MDRAAPGRRGRRCKSLREEMLEAGDREQNARIGGFSDDFFEALGVRIAEIRGASPWRVFRYRFPWLLADIGTGTAFAPAAGAFEATLAGQPRDRIFSDHGARLNESVSMQSMTLTIQALRVTADARWFLETCAAKL